MWSLLKLRVERARAALVAALTAIESASPGDAAIAAQAEVEECAAQYATALIACPGELPPKGACTDVKWLFAALRAAKDGGLLPVRLLRSSWIKALAKKLRAAASEEKRRRLALPRRQELERVEQTAFIDVDELEAMPRYGEFKDQLALGASSYCWLSRNRR